MAQPESHRTNPEVVSSSYLDLFEPLKTLNIGTVLSYQDAAAQWHDFGHVIPLSPQEDFILLMNGRMQLRRRQSTADPFLPRKEFLGQIRTEADAQEWVLGREREAETIINNTSPDHEEVFRSALSTVRDRIDQAYVTIESTSHLAGEIIPERESRGLSGRAKEIKKDIAHTVELLEDEGLPGIKALRVGWVDGGELIGVAIPVPQEKEGVVDEKTRWLVLFSDGKTTVLERIRRTPYVKEYESDSRVIHINDRDRYIAEHEVVYADEQSEAATLETNARAAVEYLHRKRVERTEQIASRAGYVDLVRHSFREGATVRPMEEVAREILGEDFLDIKSVLKVEDYFRRIGHKMRFDLSNMPEIPFTKKDIELARENDEMLLLRPSTFVWDDGLYDELTLDAFVRFCNPVSSSEEPRTRLSAMVNFSGDTSLDHAFAVSPGDIQLSWALVTKKPLSKSIGASIGSQEALLTAYKEYLLDEGASIVNVRRRTPLEVYYDTVAYFLNNEMRLLRDVLDMTSRDNAQGKPMLVGEFGETGITLQRLSTKREDDVASDKVGVCATR